MKIGDIKNKIIEVHAAARVIVQKFGHTKKFAKHIVSFVIKQMNGFTDEELADFLYKDPIGKLLGYGRRPDPSIFSKVRIRSDPRILEELYNWLLQDVMKNRPLRLVVQDSTSVPAHSRKDRQARWGVRTIPKKRQTGEERVEPFFGYKLHLNADAENEIPLVPKVETANRNDKRLFHELYDAVKRKFSINCEAKFLADSAYDSTDIYQELHCDGIKPVIAINGRGHYKSAVPKDPEYGKRWSIERIFARLKGIFSLACNRVVGIKKVTIHVFSCLIAYLVRYAM